jgi:hypothetical protein
MFGDRGQQILNRRAGAPSRSAPNDTAQRKGPTKGIKGVPRMQGAA